MKEVDSDSPWQDEELLRELYHQKGMTQAEIADELGTTDVTIGNWMDKHDIPVRETQFPELEDTEYLREEYIEKGKSTYEIADEVGCCQRSAYLALKNHGIETRTATYDKPPAFRTNRDGYEVIKTKVNLRSKTVLLHRLLAVAEYGLDELTDRQVHHENHIPWDNRPDNIEIMTATEHGKLHSEKRDRDSEGNYA